jgi:hypothetical protein
MPAEGVSWLIMGLPLVGEGPGRSIMGTGAGGGAVIRVSRIPTPSIIACEWDMWIRGGGEGVEHG